MLAKMLAAAVLSAATLAGAATLADAREGAALIIGNAAYHGHHVPKSAFAGRDALMMRRQVLTRFGYDADNVVMLRDASLAQMHEAIGTAAAPSAGLAGKIAANQTPLVFFYSGHCVPGINDARAYLLPVDANPDRADTTGLALRDVYAALQALQPRSLVMILDCGVAADSHAGPLLAAPMAATDDALLPSVGDRTIILAAASPGQIANVDADAGLGLFTRYLLLGMDGAADTSHLGNRDGRVTLGELQGWLTEEMGYAAKRRYGRVQRPFVLGPAGGVLAVAPPQGWPERTTLSQMREEASRLERSPDAFDPAPLLAPPSPASASPAAAASTTTTMATPPAAAEPAREAAPAAVPEPLQAAEAADGPRAGEDALALTREQRIRVQEGLARIGYDIGRPDGSFGPVTRRALMSWQQMRREEATGYLTALQLGVLLQLP